jgi:hypothetical protein
MITTYSKTQHFRMKFLRVFIWLTKWGHHRRGWWVGRKIVYHINQQLLCWHIDIVYEPTFTAIENIKRRMIELDVKIKAVK